MMSLGHNLKENFIGPIIDRTSKVTNDIFGNECLREVNPLSANGQWLNNFATVIRNKI